MGPIFGVYDEFILHGLSIWVTLIFVFAIISAVFFVLGSRRLRDLRHLYQAASTRKGPDALEDILLHQAQVEDMLSARVEALEKDALNLHVLIQGCVQKCKLDRYQAFRDTGGDQSFSLALLDGKCDGAIITSIFGRNESRLFAKRVVKGVAVHALSEEERKLLEEARKDLLGKKENRGRVTKE